LLDGPTLERLLYVWEFFSNFAEYFELASFKVEELHGALSFKAGQVFDIPAALEGEPDWEDYISNKSVTETGFGLLNTLHLAAVEQFFKDIRETADHAQAAQDKESADFSEDQLLNAVVKYFEKGSGEEHHWTELVRIIFKSKRFTIHPLTPELRTLCDEKLSVCMPETYTEALTYQEKLSVLEALVDGVHDLGSFKAFLNQRMEERSSYNKQKMDIYVEIKNLEARKQELVKEHQDSNVLSN